MARKKRKAWNKLRTKRKMAAAKARRPYRSFAQALKASRSSPVKRALRRRYRKFWGVEPTSVKWIDDKPLKQFKISGLVSMGRTDRVVLQPRGVKPQTLKGKWKPYADAAGRRIILLSGRKVKGPFKAVGVAPETWYTPSPGMEKSGTHKARTMWRHKHTDDGGRPPVVYADRNGKVDRNSNFVYARGTYSVTDWIRR